ncbi:tRNA(Met) cytidine acetyltransferase TmcA [Aliamphritea hakodatensis]|uniref:tRNA(Met) cytidine acetyltransferase TmcA n=1 Tax=Aliamphritea hakodatensis TaxID=2895352 RepID=UPI0022FD62EB|nr:GNAT family N-acetyltransferase [Aliamphritea hakodatensis]
MLTREYLQQLSACAGARRQRALLVISGEPDWLNQQLSGLDKPEGCLWLGSDASPLNRPDGVECISPKQAGSCLGQERQRLVVDAFAGFNPNAFGQVSGVLVAGGLMLLLVPPLDEWPGFNDPELQHIAVEPYCADDVGRRFIRRLAGVISGDDALYLIRQGQPLPGMPDLPLPEAGDPYKNPYRSLEQQQLVEHLTAQCLSKRPAVQVVTADRGRGKSASLGLLAAALIQQGVAKITVVAPALSAVEALFSAAAANLAECHAEPGAVCLGDASVRFYQPDRMLEVMPETDVLLVDEAAAIPVPVLARLLAGYSRCVFASTIHGYEGTGQGFAVRFKGLLNSQRPGWHDLRLTTPVRWAAGDPLEVFTFKALMLAAEPEPLHDDPGALTAAIQVRLLDRDALVADEALLNDVFGLLVLAHYRTTPGDLRILLDSPNLQVWGAFSVAGNELLGTMLVAEEGPLDDALAAAVFAGTRRPKGHLIPQTLLAQEAIAGAGRLKGLRIMRIAVRPELQRRRVAEHMLQQLEQHAGERHMDWLGTGFGLTPELLSFWRHNGYRLARIGLTRDSVGATHGVIMLKACSGAGEGVLLEARNRLICQFSPLLSSYLQHMEARLVADIFADLAVGAGESSALLSPSDAAELGSFAGAHRQYESCQFTLRPWLYRCGLAGKLAGLNAAQRQLLISKVLQNKHWDACQQRGAPAVSPRNLLKQLRDVVGQLLDECRAE